MPSVKQLAISGSIWTVISYGTSQFLRFGSSIILTRLLYPELFGLMALVGVFIAGLQLFSDIGIGVSVIRSKRADDPDFYNTAWTLQVIRGIGIWFCCLLFAWPVSQFYREPQLIWLIPIVGITVVIDGFSSTSLFTLNRQLAMKRLAIFELGVQASQIIVMVGWALVNKSIWALVIGSLVSSIIRLMWSHCLNSGIPNRFILDKEATHEIVSFGRWIFFSTALNFFANQSDRLVLGRLVSFEVLGVYGIAYTLSEMPKQLIGALCSKVLFPTYTKFSDLPRYEFREKIQRGRLPILIATACGLAVLVSFGDILVSTLYDSRYAAAAWMLPVLALGAWPYILSSTVDTALFVIGEPRYIAYGCFWSAVSLYGGMFLGFQLFGVAGAIIAIPLSNIPLYLVITYGLINEKLACIGQDLKLTAFYVVLLISLIGCRTLAGFPLPLPGMV